MNLHMHIALPNVQLSPDCTWDIPDLADGIAAAFAVQSEEEHSPSLHGHKVGHTEVRYNAIPESIEPGHGTSPSLYSHYNSCPQQRKQICDYGKVSAFFVLEHE